MFDQLEGLIVGGMTQMNDNEIPFGKSAEEIILSICSEYNFPIAFNFPAGHVDDNRALIMGRIVDLEVGDNEVNLFFKE